MSIKTGQHKLFSLLATIVFSLAQNMLKHLPFFKPVPKKQDGMPIKQLIEKILHLFVVVVFQVLRCGHNYGFGFVNAPMQVDDCAGLPQAKAFELASRTNKIWFVLTKR